MNLQKSIIPKLKTLFTKISRSAIFAAAHFPTGRYEYCNVDRKSQLHLQGSSLSVDYCGGRERGEVKSRYSWRVVGAAMAFSSCFVVLPCVPAWGQLVSTASISGTVSDPSGAIIPGAAVTATDTGTGTQTSTQTNNAGDYVFPSLPVGTYTVVVSKSGFKTYSNTGIALHPGIVSSENVTMHIGAISEHITVSAAVEQVQTSTPEVSSEVSGVQTETLPLNGRDYQSLSALMPGVTNTSPGVALAPNSGNVMSIAGAGPNGTLYTVDGIWNMNTGSMGSTTITPNPDTIQEVRVLQNNYSVENSLFGANVVLVETRSGTDTFHGTAFEYLRNTDLNARNYFASAPVQIKQNIFGYTFGGPFYIPRHFNKDKHKIFFFWSQQWVDEHNASTLTGATATQAMRQGTFTTPINDPLTGLPFPQSSPGVYQIPSNRLNQNSLLLMNTLASLPNNIPAGFNNYINLNPQLLLQRDDEARGDYNISSKLRLMAEYLDERVRTALPHDGADLGSPFFTNKETDYQENQLAQVRLTQMLTPDLVNNTSIAMNNYILKLTLGQLNFLDQVPGFTEVLPYTGGLGSDRLPKITFSGGWSSFGAPVNRPIPHAGDLENTISDDLSWLYGKHYIQSGINIVWGGKRQDTFASSNGVWSFNGQFTGNPIADYLLGDAASLSQQSAQRDVNLHYMLVSPWVQDQWKATRRLTLTAGVRVFYLPFDHDPANFVDAFNPSLFNPAQAPIVNNNGTITATANYNPTNGLFYNGVNGIPLNITNQHDWQLGPQVGFAYDIFGDGKTSLRGGYGITYTRIIAQCTYNCPSNPPFVQSISLVTPSFPNALAANGGATPLGAPSLTSLQFGTYPAAQLQSYSLSLEHQFGEGWIFSLAGAGSIGHHLFETWNINQPPPDAPYDYNPVINSGTVSSAVFAPYRGYSSINQGLSPGKEYWDALEASARHPVGHNLFLTVAYTWQHSLTDHNTVTLYQGGGPQNAYNPEADYGNSAFNQAQILAISHIWTLPWYQHASGLKGLALGGWKYAGITTIDSGFSLAPGLTGSGIGLASRPNRVATNLAGQKNLHQWFNTAAFAKPAAGYFGNAANGTLTGPGTVNFDMAFYKDFRIKERGAFEFRAELFNIFNHTNLNAVSTSLGAGNFGQVTSAKDPRIAEFSLRFHY